MIMMIILLGYGDDGVYFDNSATTCVSAKAADAALRAMREDFGNPSSVHGKGAAAFHALNEARSTLLNI